MVVVAILEAIVIGASILLLWLQGPHIEQIETLIRISTCFSPALQLEVTSLKNNEYKRLHLTMLIIQYLLVLHLPFLFVTIIYSSCLACRFKSCKVLCGRSVAYESQYYSSKKSD